MPDYAVKKIDDMDAALFGSFKRARAELGVEAFGMQVIGLRTRPQPSPDAQEQRVRIVWTPFPKPGAWPNSGQPDRRWVRCRFPPELGLDR